MPEPLCEGRDPAEPVPGGGTQSLEPGRAVPSPGPGALRRGRGDPGEPRRPPLSPSPGLPPRSPPPCGAPSAFPAPLRSPRPPWARRGPAARPLPGSSSSSLRPGRGGLRAPRRGRGAHGPGGAEGRRGPAGKCRARPRPLVSPVPSAPSPPRRAPGPLQHRSETQERRFDFQKS